MKTKLYKWMLPAVLSLVAVSCKNTFNIQPEDVLSSEQVYQSVADADNAVYGVYGKFMKLADRYVILNELRADLADITFKTNYALKEINNHTVTENNPYADPKPFYEVIMACNDVLKNLDVMFAEGKINLVQHDERYSDIGALRSWIYLQVGIQWGNVPYVTEPIQNINDLNNESLYQKISFDDLLAKLTLFTESLPQRGQYPASSSVVNSNNKTIVLDGVDISKIFIYRRLILGDLELWKGNYAEAAKAYKTILDVPNNGNPANENKTQWRIGNFGSPNNFNGGDWGRMFTAPFNGGSENSPGYNQEWIWGIPLLAKFAPQNPLIDLFSYTNGSYQIKPSALAISNWTKQTREDGTPGDFRGQTRSATQLGSWELQGGFPVITKFLGGFDPSKPLEKAGIWYLYRAGGLHLRFAELANRDDKHRLAYSLLSYQLKFTFDPLQGDIFYRENTGGRTFGTDWPGPGNTRDLKNIQMTPWPFPFNFDAHEANFPAQLRAAYSTHVGIRRRVGLEILRIDSAKYFDMNPNFKRYISNTELLKERPVIDKAGLVNDMENKILDEAALELAFEGNRWADLVRIARRRNDPSILAKRVAAKFRANNDNATADLVEAKLMNPQNWYLPFKIK